MSEDEIVVGLICGGIGLGAWVKWYYQATSDARMNRDHGARRILFTIPLIATLILFAILKSFASHDVRDDPGYLFFYVIMGAAWVGLARYGLHLLGISARDDVIERHNRAAAYAVAGGVLGLTLCFAGGNIGDGPGWWVVIFAAALSTAAFFLLWILLHVFTGLADSVTIDRDPSAGLRLGGFLVGIGLILGRAVAGNWISAEATVVDFCSMAWPTLLVLIVAVPIERALRPARHRPVGDTAMHGVVPAGFYILIGIVVVLMQGRWS